ncbi:hypothetical protein L7F22_066207 [Adiantum nelumboides]|nr:hypothetical protein [Adiantum nelumboides]
MGSVSNNLDVEYEDILRASKEASKVELLYWSICRGVFCKGGGCNIWKGKWIRHRTPPAYTNITCKFIQGHQDCLKNGRPDLQYLHWRWKPHDCELPLFDAEEFLELVHGKAWAFVGDSIARNQFQSILCFLAQVESPEVLYRDDRDLFVRWYFPSHNFTLQ